jgi:hypothetical protein
MAKAKTVRGAKKKGESAKKRNLLVPGDPPIIVGGGGSSLVWIRKDQEPQLIDPNSVPASAPQPTNLDLYYVFKVKDNHLNVVVNDGFANPAVTKPVHGKKQSTHFA